MMLKADKLHLKKLLSDAIPLLCKNGLPLHSMFRVEAMIGITVDESEVTLICFKETVTSDGELLPQVYGLDDDAEETEECERFGQAETGNRSAGIEDQPNEPTFKACTFRSGDSGGGLFRGVGKSTDGFADRVKFEKNDDLEMDEEGYQDANSSGYVYEGDADEGGGEYNSRAAVVPRVENRKSHAVGSEQFLVKEEVDLDVEECMFVKEEQGLDPESYAEAFDYSQPSTSIASRSRPRKGPHAFPDFSHQAAMQQSMPWQRKSKTVGQLRTRKPGGNGLSSPGRGARHGVQTAATDLRSREELHDQQNMLNDLCQEMVRESLVQTQFVCHICNARLANKYSLATHIKGSHIDGKLFRCDQCGQSFKWYMQLHRHRKYSHPDQC